MAKNYTEVLELRSCHCDMGGTWRPSAILEAMQETAAAHSAQCGLDRGTMLKMGVVWILSRTKVEMKRMPSIGEKLHIETYPTTARHLFFPRSHVFRNERGDEIGCANSLWVLLDTQTRRITMDARVLERIPDNRDLTSAAGLPATIRPLGGPVQAGTITPLYTDLDVNGHVNNTKYLDWCCNALGIKAMEQSCLSRFEVNYDVEIRPDCEVQTELTREADHLAFCGFEGGKRHFAIGGTLSPRSKSELSL